jgi:uncharacterized membrane protein (DUF373 family)
MDKNTDDTQPQNSAANDWRRFLHYTWFERGVAAVLMVGMAGVIILAGTKFLLGVFQSLVAFDDPFTYANFQGLFDRVLAAIIALELAHSVFQMAQGKHGLAQVRTVVLIGVLAVVRKFIVLEIESTSGAFLAGLGVATIALGSVYALILWIETRRQEPPSFPGSESKPVGPRQDELD